MSMRNKFLLFRVHRFRDTSAYAQLYDQYFGKIRRYIFFKVPRSEDADELAGEVFLRGWEYATSSKVEHPGALFYRIARNLISDFYRTRKETESIEGVALADTKDVLEDAMQKDEQSALLKKLKELKEEYREVLVMKYLDEMSINEIALALEKKPSTVRVTLHRAKKALQKIV